MIDNNDEKMFSRDKKKSAESRNFEDNIFVDRSQSTDDFKIYLNTIEPFTGYGGGYYELSDIKALDTTNDFIKLSEEVRKCQTRKVETLNMFFVLMPCLDTFRRIVRSTSSSRM